MIVLLLALGCSEIHYAKTSIATPRDDSQEPWQGAVPYSRELELCREAAFSISDIHKSSQLENEFILQVVSNRCGVDQGITLSRSQSGEVAATYSRVRDGDLKAHFDRLRADLPSVNPLILCQSIPVQVNHFDGSAVPELGKLVAKIPDLRLPALPATSFAIPGTRYSVTLTHFPNRVDLQIYTPDIRASDEFQEMEILGLIEDLFSLLGYDCDGEE